MRGCEGKNHNPFHKKVSLRLRELYSKVYLFKESFIRLLLCYRTHHVKKRKRWDHDHVNTLSGSHHPIKELISMTAVTATPKYVSYAKTTTMKTMKIGWAVTAVDSFFMLAASE